MQPLLELIEPNVQPAEVNAEKIAGVGYGATDFIGEVTAMIKLVEAKDVIEFVSRKLEPMGDTVKLLDADSIIGRQADIVASFEVLQQYPLEKVQEYVDILADATRRHALFSIKLTGWATPEVESEFWIGVLRSRFGLDAVERVDDTLIILARNKILFGEIRAHGALPTERPLHMEAAHETGNPYLKLTDAHNGTLHVACYGPSVADTLDLMRGQDVITLSGAHDKLIEAGITPKWHAESDPRAERARFGTPNQKVQYLVATCCHPDLFAKLKGFDVQMFHNYWGETYDDHVKKVGGFQVQAGSVTGLAAIVLGYALGYRKFEIHGMDCSYRDGQRHAGAHPGKVQKLITVTLGNPDTGQKFDTTAQMVSAAREFFLLRDRMTDCEFKIHGTGLLQSMLEYESTAKAA